MARVLTEYLPLQYDQSVIKEAKEKNQPVVVKALLQRADAKNQNGRVYPREILEREVKNYQKAIQEKRSIGQLDHTDQSIVELSEASHIIREVWWEGAEVWGKLEILNTPKGQIAKTLLESGVAVGISSRGVGDTVRNESSGYDEVCEDFTLVCWDLVADPSTHNAYLVTEGKELDLQAYRKFVPKVDRVNRILNNILD